MNTKNHEAKRYVGFAWKRLSKEEKNRVQVFIDEGVLTCARKPDSGVFWNPEIPVTIALPNKTVTLK